MLSIVYSNANWFFTKSALGCHVLGREAWGNPTFSYISKIASVFCAVITARHAGVFCNLSSNIFGSFGILYTFSTILKSVYKIEKDSKIYKVASFIKTFSYVVCSLLSIFLGFKIGGLVGLVYSCVPIVFLFGKIVYLMDLRGLIKLGNHPSFPPNASTNTATRIFIRALSVFVILFTLFYVNQDLQQSLVAKFVVEKILSTHFLYCSLKSGNWIK